MNSIKKELSYLYIIQISNVIIPLLVFPYMAHTLGVVGIGKIGFAQTLFMLFTFFIDFGFNLSGAKNISLNIENKQKINQLYSNIQFFKSIVFAVVFLVTALVLVVFDFNVIDRTIIIITAVCSFSSVLIPNFLFNGLSQNSTLAIFSFITRVSLLFPIFFFVKTMDHILIAIICIIGNSLITGILVQFYISIKNYTKFSIADLKKEVCISEVREAFDNYSASFFTLGFTYLIPLIVKYYLGDYALGLYTMVDKLMGVFRQLYVPVIQSFFSRVCIAYNEKSHDYFSYLKKISLIFLGLGVGAYISNLILGETILKFIFGNTANVSRYLSLAIITQIIISIAIIIVNFYILPSERSYILKRIYFVAFIIFTPIVYFFQNHYGLDGIYYAMQLIEVLITLYLGVYLYKNRSDLKFFDKSDQVKEAS